MTNTKNQCLICSYAGDFVWLQHCLRSLKQFSVGFLPPVVCVSYADLEGARAIIQRTFPAATTFVFDLPPAYIDSPPGFGMMRAMGAMLHGDLLCPRADNIFLVGSDCIATREFRPEDYLDARGNPIVLMNSYEHLRTVHPDAIPWRDGTARVLGFTPDFEFMRRLPSVFAARSFWHLRVYVEALHGMPFLRYWYESFVGGQRGQSEANLLGALAFRDSPEFSSEAFVNIDSSPVVYPNALLQMRSHGGLEKPIDIHYTLPSGDVFGRKPIDVINEVLGPI